MNDYVTVVMGVFGRSVLTDKTLESFVVNTNTPVRLVVVDNNSGAATRQVLDKWSPFINIRMLLNNNLGKPYAWSVGFRAAEQPCKCRDIEPSSLYCFIDNDIEFKFGWLGILSDVHRFLTKRGDKVGVVSGFGTKGAKVYKEELYQRFKEKIPVIDDASNLTELSTVAVDSYRLQQVKYPGGCQFLVSRDLLYNEGLFNTDKLIRGVDTEYDKALFIKHYNHYIVPGLVQHMGESQRTWNIHGPMGDVTLFD